MASNVVKYTSYSAQRIFSRYKSNTWVNSLTSSVITLMDEAGSYGGWICGPTKDGRIAISTYQDYDNCIYLGYGERGRTANSFAQSIKWDGQNNILYSNRQDMAWLRVIHNSSNNSDDAVVYIENKSSSDWGVKINCAGYNYGLWVNTSDAAANAIQTNGVISGWHIKATSGYLYSTCNGVTVQIGCQNSSWCHFTGAPQYYFDNHLRAVNSVGVYDTNTYMDGNDVHAARYVYCTYINESCGAEVPSTSSNWIFANGDGWLRKSTNANVGIALKNQFLHYNGCWTSGNGLSLDNANGMVFAYSNHGHPTNWGIVATFDYQLDSDYRLQLAGGGYDNTLWFRNRSSDRGGWYTGWQRVVTNSGTWSINITGSSGSCTGNAASANGIHTGSTSGSNVSAMKAIWDSLPSNQTLGVYIAHGSASFFYGWRLSDYAVGNAYGGGIIDNYGNPSYLNVYNGSFVEKHIWLQGDAVTSAVWNDYAEARAAHGHPGQVVYELGDDTCIPTTERLQHFAGIVSDTWGFSQGETDSAKTHIAVAGRVLAYPYRDRDEYKPGDVLCAAPNGTVDIMTREEAIQYPDRIVGTVSCVPNYEEWGGGEGADRPPVKVNGRIWVKVR